MPNKYRLIVGAVLILGALGYLGYTGVRNFSEYMLPVAAFASQEGSYQGQVVRLNGHISPASVSNDPAKAIVRFRLVGAGDTGVLVEYHGSAPDNMLQPVNSAVVTGELGSDGVFYASQVAMSCPSTYKAKAPGQTAG